MGRTALTSSEFAQTRKPASNKRISAHEVLRRAAEKQQAARVANNRLSAADNHPANKQGSQPIAAQKRIPQFAGMAGASQDSRTPSSYQKPRFSVRYAEGIGRIPSGPLPGRTPSAPLGKSPVSAQVDSADDSAKQASKKGLFARMTSRRKQRASDKAKATAKKKATRSFERQYGGERGTSASEAGPRAAVYTGKMGAAHKRATAHLHSAAQVSAGVVKSARKGASSLSTRFILAGVIVACVLFTGVFLFGPTQLYYQEIRKNERLQIEYEALEKRNTVIQNEVNSLNTEEGVEDRAHKEFGWVKKDDNAVSVSGITVVSDTDFVANVAPGSIKPPVTWYSAILDPIFGVS